nr:hypothetical protein Iba_scaffold29201CG0010 [Ipomoea batatas]
MCIYNILQLDTKLEIQCLQISFTIMNNFSDITRLHCRLTGFDQSLSPLNGINQIYCVWKGYLHNTKSPMAAKINTLTIKTNYKLVLRRRLQEFNR